jgi:hypothetical protein
MSNLALCYVTDRRVVATGRGMTYRWPCIVTALLCFLLAVATLGVAGAVFIEPDWSGHVLR